MIKIKKTYHSIILLLVPLWLWSTLIHANHWQSLTNGLKYRSFQSDQLSPFATLHVFDIDPKKFEFGFCPDPKNEITTAAQSAIGNNAIMAFNGAFFSTENKPLGLRIEKNIIRSKLKSISWWGVFYLVNDQPFLSSSKDFQYSPKIQFAIQAGPRLLVNGKILKLKPGLANRTALGIRSNGHVMVVITKHAPISTTFLAQFFKNELNCSDALNLDGGSSSQFYVNLTGFNKQVPGLVAIPDPVCLYPD